MKLHIGCGPRILKGWINIDTVFCAGGYGEYPPYPQGGREDFMQLDVTTTPLPLPDDSVDLIFHEDFIEHLDQRGQILFLAETLRVLKPGGGHRVNTPSLLHVCRDSNFNKGFTGVNLVEWDRWHHKNVLTPSLLEELAYMVGYRSVVFNAKDKSVFAEHLPPEYRPAGSFRREDENIFADLIKGGIC